MLLGGHPGYSRRWNEKWGDFDSFHLEIERNITLVSDDSWSKYEKKGYSMDFMLGNSESNITINGKKHYINFSHPNQNRRSIQISNNGILINGNKHIINLSHPNQNRRSINQNIRYIHVLDDTILIKRQLSSLYNIIRPYFKKIFRYIYKFFDYGLYKPSHPLGLERKALYENPDVSDWHDFYESSIILLKVEEKKLKQLLEQIKLQIEEKKIIALNNKNAHKCNDLLLCDHPHYLRCWNREWGDFDSIYLDVNRKITLVSNNKLSMYA